MIRKARNITTAASQKPWTKEPPAAAAAPSNAPPNTWPTGAIRLNVVNRLASSALGKSAPTMNTGATALTAAIETPMRIASRARMALASAEMAYMAKASAMPSTPRLTTSRWARYLSAKPPSTGPRTAARLMMAITIPASAALPVSPVTKGGINRATKALNPAPMARLETIHHSNAGPLACSTLLLFVVLMIDRVLLGL